MSMSVTRVNRCAVAAP